MLSDKELVIVGLLKVIRDKEHELTNVKKHALDYGTTDLIQRLINLNNELNSFNLKLSELGVTENGENKIEIPF